jgi:FkbM family methyltransferase
MSATALLKTAVRRALPRRVKPHTILVGPLKGCRLYTSWHDYPGALLGRTERPLLCWLGRNVEPGEIWIDVGAHYGYVALALCRLVGTSGHVFAFEPVRSTVDAVEITKCLNGLSNLTIVPYALGATPGFMQQEVSLVRGMADSTISNGKRRSNVVVTSLDSLWSDIAHSEMPIHGVKVDVQGMEIDAIIGMRNLLYAHRPKLIVEVHEGVDRNRLLNELEASGYQRDFEPIDRASPAKIMLNDHSYAFRPIRLCRPEKNSNNAYSAFR